MQRRTAKDDVIRQLASIAHGGQTGKTTIIEEYLKCPDWQLAANILARALLDQARVQRPEAAAPAPPAWLPPML